MLISLHLCGPHGDALRQQLERSLEILKDDNICSITAMLNAGIEVRDTVIDLGLTYEPADGPERVSAVQNFYGMADMIERTTFSCGDAAAYEAAVMQAKYGIPASILIAPQGGNDYHALYVTMNGTVDPTEEWIEHWNARASLRTPRRRSMLALPEANPSQSCKLIPGTNSVECSQIDGYDGCCVDVDGDWNCPSNPGVHGRTADIQSFKAKDGKRWALIGPRRNPVPVCGGINR